MKKLIIRSADIFFPDSNFFKKQADVLIHNGVIQAIESPDKLSVSEDTQVIDGKGQVLSPGFFDLNVNFGEPGFETKEDFASGVAAAAAGGFTGVVLQPNTNPPIQSRSEIAFVLNSTRNLLVDVYPLGSITKNRDGNELAELFDMKTAGAVAFGDGNRSLQHAGLMSRALLYSKGFGGLIFSFAEERSIAGKAKMNEGDISTYLGMKGNPHMAEEIMISRDLFLAEYNDAPIHFSTISTKGAVELIRQAKAKGLKVTCDVAAHHVLLTDDELIYFNSNYKVKPPLRTKEDRTALMEGLKDGTIDAIVSQHTPHEVEYKRVEFEIAEYGIASLQTVLPMLLKAELPLELIIDKLTIGPRKVLNLALPALESGALANLVLINPKELWIFDHKSNRSKGTNNPFFNTELVGKVGLVINKTQTSII